MNENASALSAHPRLRRAPDLTINIVSLFPQIFDGWVRQGVVSRAMQAGIVSLTLTGLREFGVGRHSVTDDYPFGGGAGMVMKPEPLFAALESFPIEAGTPVILLSPAGRPFSQLIAHELAQRPRLVFVTGHYEGVDERVREHAINDEISIGDYVLSCGELAAMVVVDAVVRLLPGALSEGSTLQESFTGSLLEYPHYTRPAEFRGWRAPDVLLSGNHGAIQRWRREQSLRATFEKRPDLLQHAALADLEIDLVAKWKRETGVQEQSVPDEGSL